MNKLKIIFLSILFCCMYACNEKENDKTLLSPTKGSKIKNSGWQYEPWSVPEHYLDTSSVTYNTQILILDSDTLTAERWFKKIKVKPFAKYRITGWIKTEGVKGGNENSGAGFRLGKFELSNDTIFKGNTDWNEVVDWKFRRRVQGSINSA